MWLYYCDTNITCGWLVMTLCLEVWFLGLIFAFDAPWCRQLTPSQNHNHPEPIVRTVRLTWQYKLLGKENIGMILNPGRNLKSSDLTIRLFVGLAMPHTQNDNFFNFLLQLGRNYKYSSLFMFCVAEARNLLRPVGDNSHLFFWLRQEP